MSEITASDNGPLRVSGENIVIKDGKGNIYDLSGRVTVSLCRCGNSNNKPFCDGSHRAGFQSVVTATKLPPPKPKV